MTTILNAAAIIVGINDYRSPVPQLTGSVRDAENVARWLISIGVAPSRIRLHLGGAQVSPPPGVTPILRADREAIWESIAELDDAAVNGDYLFVFMSGHGYYLSRSGPIFLAADWRSAAADRNFSLKAYAEHFQALGFAKTLFFVDACQNKDVDDIYASSIPPGLPSTLKTPKSKNGVLLCCATGQEQYAPIIDGFSLYTSRFLDVVTKFPQAIPDAPEASRYDWKEGRVQFDVVALLDHAVGPWVTEQAAARHHEQTPCIHAFGQAASDKTFLLPEHRFPAPELTELEITASPDAGVDEIILELRSTAPTYRLPKDAVLPFRAKVPLRRQLHAFCMAKGGWSATPGFNRADPVAGSLSWHFDLTPPPQPPDDDGKFNLKVIGPDGGPAPVLAPQDYAAVGVNLEASSFSLNTKSFGIEVHETGPSLSTSTNLARAHTAAIKLRDRLSQRLAERGINRQITITPPGRDPDRSLPNLKLELPEGPSACGFLEQEDLVSIERIGAGRSEPSRHSFERVGRFPWMFLSPGTYRLTVDLPWGAAKTLFEMPFREGEPGKAPHTLVRLPRPAGQEPLRNRYSRDRKDWPAIATARGGLLSAIGASPDDLFSRIPVPDGAHILALQDEDGSIRAEPYSELPWKEWDLLLGKGRLNDVNLREAMARLSSTPAKEWRSDHDILTLAVAYAAIAQDQPQLVRRLIRRLREPYLRSADLRVLVAVSEGATSADPGPGAAPLLRWCANYLAAPQGPGTLRPSSTSVWSVYGAVAPRVPEPEPAPEPVKREMRRDEGMAMS